MAHLRRSAEAARFIWTLRRLGRRPFRADDVPEHLVGGAKRGQQHREHLRADVLRTERAPAPPALPAFDRDDHDPPGDA